jgi:hypothetical protein
MEMEFNARTKGSLNNMTTDTLSWTLRKNDERRSCSDRRHFSYSFHIPERRRAGLEQEGNHDRRCCLDRRDVNAPDIEIGIGTSD